MNKTEKKLKMIEWVTDNAELIAQRYLVAYEQSVMAADKLFDEACNQMGLDQLGREEVSVHDVMSVMEEDMDADYMERVEEWQEAFNVVSVLVDTVLPSTKAMNTVMNAVV